MREYIMKRITNKEWVQDKIIEFIVDIHMTIMGLLLGYYVLINVTGL